MAGVVHVEVVADDTARAKAFDEQAFGWTIRQRGDQDYWLVMNGEGVGIDGSIARRADLAALIGPAGGVNTIDVESVDKTVARITAAGGAVRMPRSAVAGVGWLAYCTDTEGNVFGIMQRDSAA